MSPLEKNFSSVVVENQSIKFKFNNTNTLERNAKNLLVNYTHTHTDNYTVKEEELYKNNKLFESEGLRERKSANNEEEEEEE
jgi:hypothetical protein